jgi:N-acetylglutamate synthase-like GNAT family acetyltransferase
MTPTVVTVRRATADDAAAVRALLTGAGLPLTGLGSAWATFVALDGEAVVGAAALERHGPDHDPVHLLRSVVVAATHRGTGVGRALVTEALSAADDAVEATTATVGLLTETADGYFDQFGFRPVERAELPQALDASAELAGACPTTARAYLRG